jgi:thiamine biosynthesis lipoprotein
MGSDVHVVVRGDADLPSRAETMVRDLEQRWTRFRDDSELAVLNAAAGMTVVVSAETLLLVARSVQAAELTGGAFDPTVHDAMVSAGYDRTFAAITGSDAPIAPAGVPGVRGIELDAAGSSVRLPAGVHLDPGGIGKGLAADLVVEDLLARGAETVCVNVGGDLRAAGLPPDGVDWRVDVESPFSNEPLAQVGIQAGAVATSSPLKRRWRRGTIEAHHILDPRTGTPAVTAVASATVIAGEGWRAEAFAKAAVISGSVRAGLGLLAAHGIAGVLVDRAGRVAVTRDLKGRLL